MSSVAGYEHDVVCRKATISSLLEVVKLANFVILYETLFEGHQVVGVALDLVT